MRLKGAARPCFDFLEERRKAVAGEFVFPGVRGSEAFGSLPNQWNRIFDGDELPDVIAHILRHRFASTENALGFTESTIAALVGHSNGSITSKYIHPLDSVLIMAADTVSGYIQGLLAGVEFRQTAYALDRTARREALSRFIAQSSAASQLDC